VLSTKDGRAAIIAVDSAKQAINGREPTTHKHDELVVVKDFSVPIYPGLEPLGEITRGGDKPTHVVIEGENYYALETLLYTHERKVDLIYIDPPYNTGADDWIYNDRFVTSTDAYRHSKWLSFMERRLIHSRRLLNDAGVIVVAIDDSEDHRLRMLLDATYGEENFLARIVWQGNVKNDARFGGGGLDYMLVYARSKNELIQRGARWVERKPDVDLVFEAARNAWVESAGDAERASRALKKWWASLPKDSPALASKHYAFVDDSRPGEPYFAAPLMSPNYRRNLVYELRHPVTKRPFETPRNGWRYSEDAMHELIDAGGVRFGVSETTLPTKKVYLREVATQVPVPSFREDRRRGGAQLAAALGRNDFPFPKNVDVLARWIDIITGGARDAVVLDFFAGSGTTAEAVMMLNDRDGGSRQSILVTNNEIGAKSAASLRKLGYRPGDVEWEREGVYEKVTRPRIETIVSGVRSDGSTYSEGFNENVAFFRLTYEDENLVALGRRFDAIAPLLWLMAGGSGPVVRRTRDASWALPVSATYGVLFAPAQSRAFSDAIAAHDRPLRHIFVVTDSESEFQEAVGYLPVELRLETTRLYADYLRSFEINGKD
jgi:adenine-specific DNA-methyltransferase